MRIFLGAVYGGLVAWITVAILEIVVVPPIPPDGKVQPWVDYLSTYLVYGGVLAGIVIGAWRGHVRGKRQQISRRDKKDAVSDD